MPAFKKIVDYTDQELNQAIDDSNRYCQDKGLDFYKILNGIDAYMEKRNRKNAAAALK